MARLCASSSSYPLANSPCTTAYIASIISTSVSFQSGGRIWKKSNCEHAVPEVIGTKMCIYGALSALRRLKRVKLFLDCSPFLFDFEDASWQAFDEDKAATHIREILVNSAVDSSLARSIFGDIFPTSNNTTQQLRTLKLHPLLDGDPVRWRHSHEFHCILYWIARNWLLSAKIGSDDASGGEIIRVKRLKKRFTPFLKRD